MHPPPPPLLFVPDTSPYSYMDLVDNHLYYVDIALHRNLHCNCTETRSFDPMVQKCTCACMNTYYGEPKMVESASLRVDVVLPDTVLRSCKDLGCSHQCLLNSRLQCSLVHIHRCTLMDFPTEKQVINIIQFNHSPSTL